MQFPHVFIAFFMCDEAFPHVFIAFWHPQASFWEPIGLSWGLLFGMLEGPVELLGHPLGPKWSQKHQDEGHKSDLGSSGGGQGVSEALNGSILGRCSSLVLCYLVFWCVFCKKGFVHHGCSVALQLLFSMCWTWSRQRRRRGRRPHDVHVRCLEVHGTRHIMHTMVAKSATCSYLKCAWGNDLTFERASRSLAKTGSAGNSAGGFLRSH